MIAYSATQNDIGTAAQASEPAANRLSELALELVDKVGIEGAIRYCHSLGWRGVQDQVEMLRHSH